MPLSNSPSRPIMEHICFFVIPTDCMAANSSFLDSTPVTSVLTTLQIPIMPNTPARNRPMRIMDAFSSLCACLSSTRDSMES